ncbi:MAG: exonuclease SbcCD subunit D [Synergistaceae bacterium]|jgi:exonuclease SbcD|nr:exonuclease SbcCD subunit D [Synergistaceae bacterium]
MRFLHMADLHIGKSVNGFSMLEDQRHILNAMLKMTEDIGPDAVLIAGDVYDRQTPGPEAVSMFDDFLTGMVRAGAEVFIIGGNHDSPERLSFGCRIMTNVHVYSVFDGSVRSETVQDEWGEVVIHMLPSLRVSNARPFFGEDCSDPVRTVMSKLSLDPGKRNVIMAHQFTCSSTPPMLSDSELSVGGSDWVDLSLFEPFDYAALGHLHVPQALRRESLRYAGSPLKYSASECRMKGGEKSVPLVELREKGDVSVTLLPLTPLRDMRIIKGTLAGLLAASTEYDYVHAALTDREEVRDAFGQLKRVYPNIMSIEWSGIADAQADAYADAVPADIAARDPLLLFRSFFEAAWGRPMNEEQERIAREAMNEEL